MLSLVVVLVKPRVEVSLQRVDRVLDEVVLRPWPCLPEIELIALAVLNALAARAVMSWDTDNTDADRRVTDPNGKASSRSGRPRTARADDACQRIGSAPRN